ncbi:MAG: adenylate kinase [Clostridia bacterium]|nr:adenylate kinase [Clostridia bacterium]
MKLVLLGPPGAGKGTQAVKLSEKLGIPTISTGEIIRNAIKNETPVGKIAKDTIERGELVSDELVLEIVKDRLKDDDCKDGYILDGFPRTLAQAEMMQSVENNIGVDFVINIDVSDDEIVSRLSGRRVCPSCGKTYHVVSLPSSCGDKCEACGEKLIVRKDDSPEVILNRLKVYHELTAPLTRFYDEQKILYTVKGAESLDAVTAQVMDIVGRQRR